MARGRMLNRKVAVDEKVAEYGEDVGPIGLVFHHRLIAFLDVNGNVKANPYWLKGEVMPKVSGCSPEDLRRLSAKLVEHGLAIRYEVEGSPYLHFPTFRKNQKGLRPDRESAEHPVPQEFDEESGTFPETFRSTSGGSPEDVRTEVEGEVEVEGTGVPPSGDKSPSVVTPTSNGRKPSDESVPLEMEIEDERSDPVEEMHEIWHEFLGIDGHRIKLTDSRRKKYRAMYDEQLDETPDPMGAWRAVLYTVTKSDHHMSERSYQMPESILRNEDRRDRWVQKAISTLKNGGGSSADRKMQRRVRELAEGL